MGARKNNCQISQSGMLHMKFLEFYLFSQFLWKSSDIHFLGLPWEIFFGVIIDDKLYDKWYIAYNFSDFI